MARFSLFGLRSRLILLVLAAGLPALGLILNSGLEERRQAAAHAQQEALQLARLIASDQQRLIEGAHGLLYTLAQLPPVRDLDSTRCSQLFADLLEKYPHYTALSVATPDGNVFCSGLPQTAPLNIADRAYFQRTLQSRVFTAGDYVVGRITGRAVLVFAQPVLGATGEIGAVVLASLDLGWLNRLVTEWAEGDPRLLPPGATVTVIDRTGTVLARYPDPERWVGQSLPEAPIVEAILTQGEGTIEAPGINGVPRLFAFTPLSEAEIGSAVSTGAYVAVGISREVAYAAVEHALARNLAALGLVTALVLAVAWVGGDLFILRRVKALANAAQRLQAGDLSARTGLGYGRGELSDLARAFDAMAAALERREAERQRAEDELHRLNRALRTLSDCNQALVRATTEADLLHAICRIIVDTGGYRLAWVGFAGQDEVRTVRPVAQAGYEAGYLDSVNIIWADTPRGRGPTGTAIRTGRPSVARDILTDPAFFPWRAEALRRGYASSIALPLTAGGQTFGALSIYAVRPDAFDQQEVKLLAELADDLAYGITALRTRDERERAQEAVRESEERYRTLVDNTPDLIYSLDLEGRHTAVNQSICRALGLPAQEIIGKNHTELGFPEEIVGEWQALHRRVLTAGEVVEAETSTPMPDGQVRTYEVVLHPIHDREGRIAGIRGVSRDVTPRKRAEAALRESEARYRTLAEAAQDAIFIVDREDRIVYINHFGAQLAGLPPEELIGKPRTAVVPPAISEEQERVLDRVFATGEAAYVEHKLTIRDRDAWLGIRLVPLTGETGEPYAVLGVARDMTERVLAEERARRAAARAEALLRVAARLNARLELDAVLKTVCEETARALNVPASSIRLYDDKQEVFQMVATYGLPPEFRRQAQPVPRALYEESARQRGPVFVVPDVQAVPGVPNADLYAALNIRAFVVATMRREEQPVGLLSANTFGETRHFTDEELALLQGLADQAAQAIANARLYEQERARSEELSALYTLSTHLREAPTTREMLPLVLREVRALLKADSAQVVLLSKDRNSFTIALVDGHLAPNTGRSFSVDEGVSGLVLRTRQPYVTAEYAADPHRLATLHHGEETGPTVFVPLQSETELLGVLMAARHRHAAAEPFSTAEVRMLAAIGETAGNALRRAHLFEDAQRRLRQTQALRTIDMAITASLDLRVTLSVILDQVTTQLGVDAGAVLLLDPYTQTLEYAAGRGFRSEAIRRSRLRLGEGYAGRAALERRTLNILNAAETDDAVRAALLAGEEFVAYYGAPLIAKGQVKGILEVFHRAPLPTDGEWVDFLETLASQAAIAIDNAALFDDLQRSNVELTLAYDATIEGWSRALDLRDKETEGHTQRVTELTLRLARALGIREAELVHVSRGALLHDIGKMGIPDSILLKPGPLTDEEWAIMRQHPVYAYEMLAPIAYLRPALEIPYGHHEKWDGSGYPRGLKGEQIPLAARIFAVADVWDALCSDRPYRQAWPEEKALDYIRDQAGAHFDPHVVEVFLNYSLHGDGS